MTVRNTFVCSNLAFQNTWSTAWIMLQDYNISNHYAQAGYMYDNLNRCMRDYTEWDVGGGYLRNLGACEAAGTRLTAHVLYEGDPGPHPATTGYMRMEAGGLFTNAGFDPWQRGWSFQPFFAGEVYHSGIDDVPGTTSSRADIYSMGIQSVSSGSLVTIPCYLATRTSGLPTPNRYFTGATACDHIYVYTNPTN
jgi:hypothetical protein